MKKLTFLFAYLLLAIPCSAEVIFVDADAPGVNNGNSWADAYYYLQDALAAASNSDEIRVAQGIYTPAEPSGDRTATFQLKNGVAIKGGYAGFGAPDPNARDICAYETILSGDLNGNDIGDLYDESRAENSYHVVTGSGTDANAVLDGFIITAGNAYNDKCSIYDSGGGMYNHSGNPTVINCTFTRNTASDQCGGGGAGMYNNQSSPTVINCTFAGNEYIIADDDGGGGMCNYQSSPTLINCLFADNASNGDGGGMFNSNSSPTLDRCTFINNSSAHEGGAMENHHSNPTLTYCVFINNSAYREGGGMRNTNWSSPTLLGCAFTGNSVTYQYSHGGGICNNYQDSPTLINCLFTGNSAQQGGGMYSYWGTATLTNCTFSDNSAADKGGAMYYRSDSATLTNCIVWGNIAGQGDEIYSEFFENPATMTVSHSDIRGGSAGIHVEPDNTLNWETGNIDVDPYFVNPSAGDYYLLPTSPCINTGDPNYVAEPNETDLDSQPRIIDDRIDMGAYEFQGPRIYYVDDDAVGNNDGSSWDNAYNYLQDALDAAFSEDEIRVAQGIYTPAEPSGDRTATFHLINGVAINGGYAGVGAPDPDARDITAYETILSGDLNGNDVGDLYDESRAENSRHVVTGSGTDANAVLEGFTITGGNTHDWPTYNGAGAGMYNHTGSPTLTNCTFIGNSADIGGG
ncbi:MAG: right-handed parallel beta-helix repeat-containing protein, partial [Planctomycetota bacterium]